ncbi:MAG: hypothetical protein M0R17_02715 [Candidatus Omnitrophica bacterium]|jgi:hypothetical protein|nr:hypothetical protein [Candidatus Omnitrophota bacterium]
MNDYLIYYCEPKLNNCTTIICRKQSINIFDDKMFQSFLKKYKLPEFNRIYIRYYNINHEYNSCYKILNSFLREENLIQELLNDRNKDFEFKFIDTRK